MNGFIGNTDYVNMPAQKYYAPPNSWSAEKKRDTARSRIFSGTWYGAWKKDGYFERFVKDEEGNMFLVARSKNVKGEYPDKIEWVPQLNDFFESIPNGSCFLGEVYLPNNEGSKNTTSILGCLKEKAIARQEKNEFLHYYIFDVLAWDGEEVYEKPFLERLTYLEGIKEHTSANPNPYIEVAKYYTGEELWNTLQNILASGGEGMVIVNGESPYKPDKRSVKDTLKIKQELKQTIDCIVMGANPPTKNYTGKDIENWTYWHNTRTGEFLNAKKYKEYSLGEPLEPVTKNFFNNWAGSLKIGLVRNDKVEYFGDLSGLTEEVLENWKNYVGKVCEVGGMSIDKESGHIRHPRFMGWRDDKEPRDCGWEQIYE